jgi:hypothetical protein
MIVQSRAFQTDASADVIAGTLNGSAFGIFVNDLTLSPDTVLADLTVPGLAGLIPVPCVFSSPFIGPNGEIQVAVTSHLFRPTAPVVTQVNVYGWFIENNDSTVLLMAEKLAVPVFIQVENDGLIIQLVLTLFNQPI